jgi:hypothetical protein
MKDTKGLVGRISTPLIIAGILLSAGAAFAQDKKPDTPAQSQSPAEAPRDSGIRVPGGGFAPLASPAPEARGPVGHPCKYPMTFTMSNGDATPANAADFGSIFSNVGFGTAGTSNQPTFFGRTFVIPKLPNCCTKVTSASLTVVYFAKIPGGTVGGPNSSNDTGGLVENGNPVSTSYGFIGHPAGTAPTLWTGSKTVTYNVPLTIANGSGGTVSFHASDNATVVSATLTVKTCCDS